MNHMDDQQRRNLQADDLDRTLDAALANYAAVEPRAGLEDRILVRVRAEALRPAGVLVEYKEYPGMIHAFFGMVPVVDDAMNAQRAVWAAFQRAFA